MLHSSALPHASSDILDPLMGLPDPPSVKDVLPQRELSAGKSQPSAPSGIASAASKLLTQGDPFSQGPPHSVTAAGL